MAFVSTLAWALSHFFSGVHIPSLVFAAPAVSFRYFSSNVPQNDGINHTCMY